MTLATATIVLFWFLSPSNAFVAPYRLIHPSLVAVLQSSSTEEEGVTLTETDESGTGKESTATLSLIGTCLLTTDEVPVSSPDKVLDFLHNNRNCMLSAGFSRPCADVETTPELLAKWKEQAALTGAEEPDASDGVVKVNTGTIQFPGLTLSSEAFIGCKLLSSSSSSTGEDDGGYPVLESCMIQDRVEVSGAKPVVWLFQKLTNPDQQKSPPRSVSRITARVDGNNNTMRFESDANLVVQVNFPKLLLRLLPTNKEKAEEQGSNAISKSLEKEVTTALKALQEEYQKWIDKAS